MSWDTLEYKGYVGSVLLDPDHDELHGSVVNMARDGMTFVARDVPGLRAALKDSVEYYLEDCRDSGVAPDPPLPFPDSSPVHTYLPPAVFVRARELGAAEGLTAEQWVARCVERAVAAEGTGPAPADSRVAGDPAAPPVRAAV